MFNLWVLELAGEASVFSSVPGEIITIATITTYLPGRVLGSDQVADMKAQCGLKSPIHKRISRYKGMKTAVENQILE